MHYKTIALELIEDHPALHRALKAERRMLSALEAYAVELKTLHESWMKRLQASRPGSLPPQVSSEALELAIEALRDRLQADSPTSNTQAP